MGVDLQGSQVYGRAIGHRTGKDRTVCVMEVRPGQHNATIAQACAHNIQTVVSDLKMFERILDAREQDSEKVRDARASLKRCEEKLLDIFSAFVVGEVVSDHHEDIAQEPDELDVLEKLEHVAREVAEKDRTLARKYETR